MKMDTKIILSHDDMFQAFKEYIANNVAGAKAEDIANFRIEMGEEKTTDTVVVVQLIQKTLYV